MSGNTTSGSRSTNNDVLGSIVIIIVVMLVVTTTLNYSAPLATESSSATPNSSAVSSSTSASSTGTSSATSVALAWNPSTSYPTSIWTNSCVSSGGYIYCVGGLTGANTVTDDTNAVYYAPISASGIGNWAVTTSYPIGIRSEACVTQASTIYCVGGYNSSTLSNVVYYAPLSSSGVGAWTNTTSYPFPVWLASCVSSSTGIYCVGGGTSSSALSSSADVYFAPFTSSGIGQWVGTTSYPVAVKQQSCVATAIDVYCVGGYTSTAAYYASLAPSGVGEWKNTTGYPFTVGANLISCVAIGGEIVCVGGHTGPNVSSDVYQAMVSPSGIGKWLNSTNYPVGVFGQSCVTSAGKIYCVGGETASGSIINATYSS